MKAGREASSSAGKRSESYQVWIRSLPCVEEVTRLGISSFEREKYLIAVL